MTHPPSWSIKVKNIREKTREFQIEMDKAVLIYQPIPIVKKIVKLTISDKYPSS